METYLDSTTLGHLRALSSAHDAEREEAFDSIQDTIYFCGGPTKSCLAAIPLLVEIVANSATPNPDRAVSLLKGLAGRARPHRPLRNLIDCFPPEPADELATLDQLERDIRDMLRSHAAVFAARLESSDGNVREDTASLMLRIDADTDRSIGARVEPALQTQEEEEDAGRALLIPLLVWNGPELHRLWLAIEFEANHGPLSRLIVAMELAEYQSPLQERALDYLTSVYRAGDEEFIKSFHSMPDWPDFWVRVAVPILRAGGDRMLACLPALTRRVQRDAFTTDSRLLILGGFTLNGWDRGEPDEDRRAALLAFAVKAFVRILDQPGRGSGMWSTFGLPTDRSRVDEWLGLPSREHPGFRL